MKPEVSRRRLLMVAEKIESLSPKRFNYGKWIDIDTWKGNDDFSCGTSACALGWATTIPALRRVGLKMHKWGSVVAKDEYGYVRTGSSAGAVTFGITLEEAYYLFQNPDFTGGRLTWEATAKQVAEHIRKFVDKKFPIVDGKVTVTEHDY